MSLFCFGLALVNCFKYGKKKIHGQFQMGTRAVDWPKPGEWESEQWRHVFIRLEILFFGTQGANYPVP